MYVYAEWDHLNRFAQLYPMEETFFKKWSMPIVDMLVSYLNKKLTCPVDDVQFFKDPADRGLKTLVKAGAAMRPAMAAIVVCQSPKDRIKWLAKKNPSHAGVDTSEIFFPGLFVLEVDALKDSIQQISWIDLVVKKLVHRVALRKIVSGIQFSWEIYLEMTWIDISKRFLGIGTPSCLSKRKGKCPAYRASATPASGSSASRECFQHSQPAGSIARTQGQGQKKHLVNQVS